MGKIAICLVDGDFTAKRIKKEKNNFYLIPVNKKHKPIELKEENELIIWGIVEYIIKKYKLIFLFKDYHYLKITNFTFSINK